MKKNYYCFVVYFNKKYSSYFGLDEDDRDLLSTLLNNLKINYDIYLLVEEKRHRNLKI